MSADDGVKALAERLEAELPEVGPTRRLRLRAERERTNRERPSVAEELLRIGYTVVNVDFREARQRAELVAELRALARRIEEGAP